MREHKNLPILRPCVEANSDDDEEHQTMCDMQRFEIRALSETFPDACLCVTLSAFAQNSMDSDIFIFLEGIYGRAFYSTFLRVTRLKYMSSTFTSCFDCI